MDIKVNFSGRAIRYTEEEIAVVVEAMRNADPLTQSRYMQEFESKFARYQGVAQGSCFTAMNDDFGGNYKEDYAVTDGRIITGKSAAATIDFGFAILAAVAGAEAADKTKKEIYYKESK